MNHLLIHFIIVGMVIASVFLSYIVYDASKKLHLQYRLFISLLTFLGCIWFISLIKKDYNNEILRELEVTKHNQDIQTMTSECTRFCKDNKFIVCSKKDNKLFIVCDDKENKLYINEVK